MNLALELRPTYGSMVREYVDLGTIFADAPIEIRARAQEDRLQMLKRLEAQATQDAKVWRGLEPRQLRRKLQQQRQIRLPPVSGKTRDQSESPRPSLRGPGQLLRPRNPAMTAHPSRSATRCHLYPL